MKRRLPNPFRRDTDPLTCDEVGELLQHYLDDHVDAELAGRIEAHLDDCRRCGLEAQIYRDIKQSLAARRPAVPRQSLERLRAFGESLANNSQEPTGL